MDVLVIASQAPQRWALADGLGVTPDDAMPPAEGFARLAHPVGCGARALVVVVGDGIEVDLLQRLVDRASTPPMVVLAMSQAHADLADGLGVQHVVDGHRFEPADQTLALRSRLAMLGVPPSSRARATA